MGTTATALQSQAGMTVGFALLIEGYPYIITDGPLGAVTTAYAGTGWEKALPGLKVEGTLREAIKPFQPDITVSTLTFRITPNMDDYGDGVDVFGRDVFKVKPTYKSQLAAVFQAASDGSGTLTVKDATQFPDSAGYVYVGNKRMKYTSKGSNTFAIAVGGADHLAPFDADSGNKYSKPHTLPDGQNWSQGPATWVTDNPAKWIGRKVALYIHRIVGGVWDTRAQAHLEFAGRIAEIEQAELGVTILQCEDLRAELADCVLMTGQWIGYVKPGVWLQTGEVIYAHEKDGGHNVVSTLFTVVSSGASGNFQINAGLYELEEFLAALNKALTNDTDLNGTWTIGLESSDGGMRVRVKAQEMTSGDCIIGLSSNSAALLEFLGYGDQFVRNSSVGGTFKANVASTGTVTSMEFWASRPAFRVRPFQKGEYTGRGTVEFFDKLGTWMDVTDFLPAPYDKYPAAGENWSFIRAGNRLFFGRYIDDTKIDNLTGALGFAGYAGAPVGDPDVLNMGLTVDDAGDRFEVRQVACLSDTFTAIVASIFASTGVAGVNHATYDVFPSAMSCPGIPWGLLDDEFEESCQRLDQALKTESMMVVLDKPTKLIDVFPPDFLLRFAWLIFKGGKYVFASPPTPNSLTTDHTLDETNKAGPPENLRSQVRLTNEYLTNVINLKFNRTANDKFASEIVIRNEASISDYSDTKAATIEAPNSYPEVTSTGASVEDLGICLAQRTLPTFGKPLYLVRRTIAPTMFPMAPGDTVSLSDDDIRDPTSGEPGLGNRACVCLSVSHSYGHESGELFGEVELLLTDEDRTYPLAPCAEVDTSYSSTVDGITFTNGYAASGAGGPALKLKSHQHSRSTDAVDTSQFAATDLIRIIEIDPADTAAPDAWSRTVSSVDSTDEYIVLNSNLSSPAWSGSTKLYRVTYQLYDDCTESQQLHAFLADDGDGLIQDVAQPNLYGEYTQSGAFARAATTDLPALIPTESYSEGRPLHAGLFQDWIRMGNNIISYKGAPHCPMLFTTVFSIGTTAYSWAFSVPFFLGGTAHKYGRRYLKVSPIIATANAAETATCRVTSSQHHPSGTSTTAVTFTGASQSVTFTRTGATTEAAIAVQNLPLVEAADLWGFTWLTVELKTSNAGVVTTLRGFQQLWLGPLE